MRSSWLFVLLLLLICANPDCRPARADKLWSWVQITCSPELRMFSIRRLSVVDPPATYLNKVREPSPAIVKALERKFGIYDSKSLKSRPVICTIPPLAPAAGWHGGGDG